MVDCFSLSQWTLKKSLNLISLLNMESPKVQKVSHWLSKFCNFPKKMVPFLVGHLGRFMGHDFFFFPEPPRWIHRAGPFGGTKKVGSPYVFATFSGWWFQPISKICSSKWESSPIFRGENKKCLKPPPSFFWEGY